MISRWLTRSLLTAPLWCGACTNISVPPQVRHTTLRVGPLLNFTELEAGNDDNQGPHPALEMSLDTMISLEDTTATALEVAGAYGSLDLGGDIEGRYWQVRLGAKRIYNLERPLRPTLSLGGGWTTYDQTQRGGSFDIKGPMVYLGGGLEYSLSPGLGFGTELRGSVQYLNANREYELVSALDLAFHVLFRF